MYGVVEKFMEDFYGREPGDKKKGMNGRIIGRLGKDRVNGPVRRNEGGMRDSRNGMNQERKCFRCGKTGHVKAQCRWSQSTCFSFVEAGHLAREC